MRLFPFIKGVETVLAQETRTTQDAHSATSDEPANRGSEHCWHHRLKIILALTVHILVLCLDIYW